jgi:large subunit ribosomal protein L3
MSRLFVDRRAYAITLLKVPASNVLEKKQFDSYSVIRLGLMIGKKIAKPQLVDLERQNLPRCNFVREFKVSHAESSEIGETITQEWLNIGDMIDIQSKTIGKGFAGGMKLWGFSGQPASHGVSLTHRSIGSTGTRKKIFKQKKMPGRMGSEYVTIQNQKIIYKDEELGLIGVIGAVPGKSGSWTRIMKAIKSKGGLS